MEAREIIIKPILTEKSYENISAKKYTKIFLGYSSVIGTELSNIPRPGSLLLR